MKVNVMSDILKANDIIARDLQQLFNKKNIACWNIMGSPGSGKTTILEKLIPTLPEKIKAAVIEGDIATSHDAERIARTGVQSTQINTQGACHLDAAMVKSALDNIDLEGISLLFIENVGNLVCPAGFLLGETGRIIISSITEGDDKPEKYPAMFRTADLVVVNKVDLSSQVDFTMAGFIKGMKKINPDAEIMAVSATNGQGMDKLRDWVVERV
ncbi:MAG: hydrogenase nickel incorporation protein HypB [Spirochaetota bacterium]